MNSRRVQRPENGTPVSSARPASLLLDAREQNSGAPAPSRKPEPIMKTEDITRLAIEVGALEIDGEEWIFDAEQLQHFANEIDVASPYRDALEELDAIAEHCEFDGVAHVAIPLERWNEIVGSLGCHQRLEVVE